MKEDTTSAGSSGPPCLLDDPEDGKIGKGTSYTSAKDTYNGHFTLSVFISRLENLGDATPFFLNNLQKCRVGQEVFLPGPFIVATAFGTRSVRSQSCRTDQWIACPKSPGTSFKRCNPNSIVLRYQ